MRYLPKEEQERFKTNPLRLLDSKNKRCIEIALEAPQIVDYLDEESKAHLMSLLEYMDEFDLPYVLNPRIVRGLDYYTKTVFEIWAKDDDGTARMNALGGGGRYDGLIGYLGGKDTPAVGVALGIERIIAKIREKNLSIPNDQEFSIFLAHLGDEASRKAFCLFENLRAKGYKITWNLSKKSLKQQLEIADKLKVKITLILGQKEIAENQVLIKEMDMGAQESVPTARLEKELEKRLRS
jgi:histidyl-tRNA synthetase